MSESLEALRQAPGATRAELEEANRKIAETERSMSEVRSLHEKSQRERNTRLQELSLEVSVSETRASTLTRDLVQSLEDRLKAKQQELEDTLHSNEKEIQQKFEDSIRKRR